jgi:predicted Zn-ribbon and HTH transcriptional regulator
MYRKGLIELLQQRPWGLNELLLQRPWGLNELAEHLQTRPRELEDDLRHLLCSVKHQGHRVVIEPARRHHCGFTFKRGPPR